MKTLVTIPVPSEVAQAIESNLLQYPEIAGEVYCEMARGVYMGAAIRRASANAKSNLSRRERKSAPKIIELNPDITAQIITHDCPPVTAGEIGLAGLYAQAFQLRLEGLTHAEIGKALQVSAKEAGRILLEIFSKIRQELS